MVSIAGILGNNSIGYQHKLSKVNRAIRRSAGRLLETALKGRKHYIIETEDNAFLEVIWGTPDYARLEQCFRHIAMGVYFHHFGKRFSGELKLVIGQFHYREKNPATFLRVVEHKAKLELMGEPEFGENPEVFFYQVTKEDQHGILMIRLCFYQGFNIYVACIPEGTNLPSNFVMKMIAGGIKTYVTLDDATYEFN